MEKEQLINLFNMQTEIILAYKNCVGIVMTKIIDLEQQQKKLSAEISDLKVMLTKQQPDVSEIN